MTEISKKYEIARIILAVWDSRQGQYLDNVSDQYVADTYGFSVDDVRTVRQEFYEDARDIAKRTRAKKNALIQFMSDSERILPDLARSEVAISHAITELDQIAINLRDIRTGIVSVYEKYSSGDKFEISEIYANLRECAIEMEECALDYGLLGAVSEVISDICRFFGVDAESEYPEPAFQRLRELEIDVHLAAWRKPPIEDESDTV